MLTGILDLLGPEDRVSIVLFSTDACQPLPLGKVGCLDVKALKADIEVGCVLKECWCICWGT